MGKKSKRRNDIASKPVENEEKLFPQIIEDRFKHILRIMSWIVGICFTLIIILPNFDFYLVDAIVKFVFFLGVFNLLLFAVLEMFGNSIKQFMSKNIPKI